MEEKESYITLDSSVECWTLTMHLRWKIKDVLVGFDTWKLEKVLQQKSRSNFGNEQWIDIKIE